MPATPAKLSTMPSLPARIIAYFFVGILCAAGPVMLLIAAGTSSSAPSLSVPASLLRASSSDLAPSAPTDLPTSPAGLSSASPRRTARASPSPPISPKARLPGVLAIASVFFTSQTIQRTPTSIPSSNLGMPQVIVGIVGGAFSAMPFLIFVRRRGSANVASGDRLKSAHSPAGERYRYHGTTPSLVDQRALDQPVAERDGFIDAAGESPSVAAEVRKLPSGLSAGLQFPAAPGPQQRGATPTQTTPTIEEPPPVNPAQGPDAPEKLPLLLAAPYSTPAPRPTSETRKNAAGSYRGPARFWWRARLSSSTGLGLNQAASQRRHYRVGQCGSRSGVPKRSW